MEPGDLLAGRFEIVHRASSGGMAAVYFARDRSNDAPVAIKVLHEHTAHEAARFVREGQLLAQLQHPGIVRYVGHGTTRDGAVFLAMEWLDGEDLSRRLKTGPLSVAQAAQLGQQAAEALGVAHAAGVIHRDLKPSNLFLVSGALDQVKLLDFGIARPAVPGHSITATGAVVGTPGYMAPEQARSAKRVDPRADVFSLGCVLYRCVAGRDPFGSGNPMAVLLRVVLEEPKRLDVLAPSVPKAFADVVARMMAKAPEERPVDGTAVAVALGRIRPELGPAASTPLDVPPSSRTDPRRPTQRGLGPLAAPPRPAEAPRSDRAGGPAMTAAPALAARIPAAGAAALPDLPARADSKAWARRAPSSNQGAPAPSTPPPTLPHPNAPPPTPSPLPTASAPTPSQPSAPPPRPSTPAAPGPPPLAPAAPAAAPSAAIAPAPPLAAPHVLDRAPALTTAEQRVVCLVLARPGAADVAALAAAASPTLTGPDPDRLLGPSTTSSRALEPLFSAVSRHGGRLDRLADDSLLVTFPRPSAAAPALAAAPPRVVATDEAARAARCALAIRPLLSHGPVALVAGRAEDPDRVAIDEAIDRGVHLLDRPPARGIWVDDMMAGLLDLRFEVVVQAEGLVLRGERAGEKVGRTLLGRVTPCVGRDAEVQTLLAQLGECASGRGARAVLVTGPPGVGKSRLRDELARQAARRGEMVQIWHARGEPTAAGAPFGMMATALREAFGIAEGDGVEARQHKLWARLSRSLRGEDRLRVALFLGELVGAPFPDERSVQLAAARGDMRLMGDQIRRACEDLVSAECSAMPLLFVVEDLQWGDWPTMVLFETLLRNLPRAPLMLLGLGRPEVRERFAAFVSAPSTHIIELGPLSREACIEIARAALGDVALAELGRLADRSGGNAFFLEELVRAVAAGKGDELPATVVAMVEARLEGLQPSERHVLRAAALLGPRFVAEGIRVLVGEPYTIEQVTALLELLCGAELLVRIGEAGPTAEYAFRQDLVRQAAYSMLTAADRQLGHRLAGDWLERSGRRDALVLAEHFEQGQEPARAVPWYLQAAEQALRGDDLDVAIERAERGVGCGARGDKLGRLRLIQAEALAWRGELRAAEARASEAVELLPAGDAAWCAAVGELARVSGELGNHDRLVGLARELGAALGKEPPAGEAARAMSSVAVQLLWAGKMELADPLLEQLDRAVDASDGDPATVAHVFRACGARALVEGDPAAALELTRMVMRCHELVGNLREACIQRGNCGAAYMELGAWSEAEAELGASLETAERLGLDSVSSLAKLNLCPTLGRQGRIEEGRTLGLEALAAFKVEANSRLESAAHVYLAEVLTLAGDLAAARRHTRAGVDTSPPGPAMAFALAARARVELAAGSAREAFSCAEQAMTLLTSLGGMDEGESMLRLVWAEALSATGRHDEARRAITEARRRLLARAEKITSPEWRRSFLERVGENARTLSLARVWLGESESD